MINTRIRKIGKKENAKRKTALQRIAAHKSKIVNLFNDFNNKQKSIHKIDMENIDFGQLKLILFNFILLVTKTLLWNGKVILNT